MKIGNVEVGGNAPCRVVAEMSNAFNGSLKLAHQIVDAAKACNADFLKVQAYTPQELVDLRGDGPAPEPWGAQGWTMRDLYTKAQLPLKWLPELFDHARSIGITPFASVFGPESFAALEALDNPCYKLAALDWDSGFIYDVAQKTGKPIIASCPHTAPRSADLLPGVHYLYAPPGYPQTKYDLKNIRNGFLGFSYHGTKIDPPVVAVIAGAKLVEVHFQLDDAPSELEANVSLGERKFTKMVRAIRRVEGMM